MATKKFLLTLNIILLSFAVNATEPLVDRSTYNRYLEESLSNSAEKWVLYKVDENYYYIQREVGFSVKDRFRLKKDETLIETKKRLPTNEFVVKWKE